MLVEVPYVRKRHCQSPSKMGNVLSDEEMELPPLDTESMKEDGRDVESQNSKMDAAGRHRSVTRDGIFVNQWSPHEREALIRPTMVYVSWRCVWCFALR